MLVKSVSPFKDREGKLLEDSILIYNQRDLGKTASRSLGLAKIWTTYVGTWSQDFSLASNRGSFHFRVKANKKFKCIKHFSVLSTVIKQVFNPNNNPESELRGGDLVFLT